MIKKQGITVTMLVTTIMILIILAGIVTFSTYSTIKYSELSTWTNEIIYIQDVINEQSYKTSAINFVTGNIFIDVSNIEDVSEQFGGETISPDNTVNLKIIDLGKLKITNTIYGILKTERDVYALSEQTGKVYYVQGLQVDDETYYCVTDALKETLQLDTVHKNLSSIVFMPSIIGYTNQPINVLVKIPNTFTDIQISTSNEDIIIGEQQIKQTTYEYLVNGGETPIADNYKITVSYNDGTKNITSIYEVNGYDITPPVINEITDSNFVYRSTDSQEVAYMTNITATDESGIKVIKYEHWSISEQDARNYFRDNGKIILNGKINCGKDIREYTIYAEDNAGNFSIQVVNMTEESCAIYSETDNSLTFLRTDKKIKAGDIYNKKQVTAIYKNFEQATYDSLESVPWNNYRTGIKSVSVEDVISPVSIQNWFVDMTNCSSLNLEKVNTSNVTSMFQVFQNVGSDSSVTNFNIYGLDNWDVSNVTRMDRMFRNVGAEATTWNIGNLGKWNVAKVLNMSGMFGKAYSSANASGSKLNIGDLSTKEIVRSDGSKYTAWDVSSVTDMTAMFDSFGKYATYDYANGYLDLTNWDVSSVEKYTYFNSYIESKIKAPTFQ